MSHRVQVLLFYSHLHIKWPTCFGEIYLNSPSRPQFRDSHSQSSQKKINLAGLGPIVTLFDPDKEFHQNMLAV
jgi:hypothetical protein